MWLWLALLVDVGFIGWLLRGLPRDLREGCIELAGLSFLSGVAGWVFLKASHHTELPAALRLPLRLIGIGPILMVLGSLILVQSVLQHGRMPETFGFADVCFLGVYLAYLAGLVQWPKGEKGIAGPGRILIDGLVFVIGLGVPLWLFAVGPHFIRTQGLEALFILVWPIAAFTCILTLNTVLLTKAPLPRPAAFWLLLTSFGLGWLADLLGTLDVATNLLTAGVNWPNVINAISVGLFIVAGWLFQTSPAVSAGARQRPAALSPVPFFTLVAVGGWLALSLATPNGIGNHTGLVPSLVVLIVALLIREVIVLRDSFKWLNAELQRRNWGRFESVVRNSSDLILIVDHDRRIRFANAAARTSLGYTPEELHGRTLTEFVHQEDLSNGETFFNSLARHPGSTDYVLWQLRRADGSHGRFETAGSLLQDDELINGYIFNLRDITERLAMEERLHHAQKMEAIGRLAGGVAHDFNNLLAVIMANSELALDGLAKDHQVRPEVSEIRRASSRGTQLTNRLLALSRRDNAPPEALAPGELLRSLAPTLLHAAGPRLALETQIEPDAGLIMASPDGLEQALINLTTNARDASGTGGKLLLRVRNQLLADPLASRYLSAPPGDYVVIEATDSGSGMDEATLARLFEPFFTTKERGKGTGLGLAAVYGMVKAARGGITVRSTSGEGSTISLWLPRASTPSRVAAAETSPVSTTGTETILLVEDEDTVRLVTERILQKMGYEVLSASNADEAEQVLAAHKSTVHLILSDVYMPGRSGPALATTLVRERPDLRVLFMSGYTGNELEAHGIKRQGARLLIKPFSVEQLKSKIRQALAGPPGLN